MHRFDKIEQSEGKKLLRKTVLSAYFYVNFANKRSFVTALRMDFTPSTQPIIMFCFSVYFDLIACTQRCEIYSSEREYALSFRIFCFTKFMFADMKRNPAET